MNQVDNKTPSISAPSPRAGRRLHPLPVRVMHWINATVMLVMITSGWGIYDDNVIIRGLHFSPFWRLGDWAAWSLNPSFLLSNTINPLERLNSCRDDRPKRSHVILNL